jgi:hypothetical protein
VGRLLSQIRVRKSASSRNQANARGILEVTRTCFEIVPHTQTEMAKLVGEHSAMAKASGDKSTIKEKVA